MKRIHSVVAENFEELKFEIYNNYKTLNNVKGMNPNIPCVRIWDLLDVDTQLPELEKFKSYLKSKFHLKAFQICIYSPFSGTGFHSDGHFTNRYIYPLVSDENAINLEIDINHVLDDQRKHYEDNLYYGGDISRTILYKNKYLGDLDKWFFNKSENNKMFIIPENECWEIGKNIHAHLNFSFDHRIIVVFDTQSLIEE